MSPFGSVYQIQIFIGLLAILPFHQLLSSSFSPRSELIMILYIYIIIMLLVHFYILYYYIILLGVIVLCLKIKCMILVSMKNLIKLFIC